MAKVLQCLVTLTLFLLFLYSFSINLKNLLSNKAGSLVRVEYETEFPDFTFCPLEYAKV